MLDVGPDPGGVDDLLGFVDRLGAAGSARAAARAHDHVRRLLTTGPPPPGLRRIAEGLTAADAAELPPPPRQPADDPGSVAAAVAENPLLVLDDVEPDEVAAAVGALVDDGRRVVVTAAEADALAAVRRCLPATAAARAVDALPPLSPADLHRLRALLATSTPARRARPQQQLPPMAALPDAGEVAARCAVALRAPAPGTERVAPMLADLEPDRLEAVTAVAGCVRKALAELSTHPEPWTWELLADLVHGRRRSAFDSLVQSAAQALATADDGRDDPPVRVEGPLPGDAVETLVAYLEYRESGGRTRGPFRPAVQREVAPVLRLLRVGDRVPETAADLRIVLTHFELGERLVAVDRDCAALDLPTPRDTAELGALSAALVAVAAAARSVGALRHDILFLGASSPVAVPDVRAAEQLASAVLDFREHGSAGLAAEWLDAVASGVEGLAPPEATAPEHARAVAALRARDAAGYAAAVDELAAAHRELVDEQRSAALLAELGVPALVSAWTAGSAPDAPAPACGRGHLGFVWFARTEQLLEALPAADRADVVVVLDAGSVGVDRALLAAAAPRLVAAVAPGRRAGTATLSGLLNRASALVIRGRAARTAGRVVQLTPAPRARPVRGGGVEQAGA